MSTTVTRYITRDEYVDYRNIQDTQLNQQFAEIRSNFQAINTRLDTVETRLSAVEKDVREIKVEINRQNPYLRNSVMRNPTRPIHAIPILHPTTHVMAMPDHFPKNAREFYSLRTPETNRQHQMLRYLIHFYDISPPEPAQTSDDDESESDDETVTSYERAVELLEGILGLQEQNFVAFEATARAQKSAQPTKRTHQELDTRLKKDVGGSRHQTIDLRELHERDKSKTADLSFRGGFSILPNQTAAKSPESLGLSELLAKEAAGGGHKTQESTPDKARVTWDRTEEDAYKAMLMKRAKQTVEAAQGQPDPPESAAGTETNPNPSPRE